MCNVGSVKLTTLRDVRLWRVMCLLFAGVMYGFRRVMFADFAARCVSYRA